jgi:hypothetical protein
MQAKVKTLVPLAEPGKFQWVFSAPETIKVGDRVEFTGNGRGRGGHYHVAVIVTELKRKTFLGTEAKGSYGPGTLWRVNADLDNLYISRVA